MKIELVCSKFKGVKKKEAKMRNKMIKITCRCLKLKKLNKMTKVRHQMSKCPNETDREMKLDR